MARKRRYCPSCDALVNGRTGRVDCRLCGADTHPWPDDAPDPSPPPIDTQRSNPT
jgi:hypothetical protein